MAGKDALQDLCKETVEDAGLEPVWWTSESLGRTSPKKEVHMSTTCRRQGPPYPPEFKAVRPSGYFRSSTRSIPQIELGRSISPTRDPAAQPTGSARQRDLKEGKSEGLLAPAGAKEGSGGSAQGEPYPQRRSTRSSEKALRPSSPGKTEHMVSAFRFIEAQWARHSIPLLRELPGVF
jgi:hypothetical protein